jgi:hypothetical protein
VCIADDLGILEEHEVSMIRFSKPFFDQETGMSLRKYYLDENVLAEMGSERVQPESARCLARDFVKPDRSREELAETRP